MGARQQKGGMLETSGHFACTPAGHPTKSCHELQGGAEAKRVETWIEVIVIGRGRIKFAPCRGRLNPAQVGAHAHLGLLIDIHYLDIDGCECGHQGGRQNRGGELG